MTGPILVRFARHGGLHMHFQLDPLLFWSPEILRHQEGRFLSDVERYPISVSHSSILVFLDSERLSQPWTMPQATRDLVS